MIMTLMSVQLDAAMQHAFIEKRGPKDTTRVIDKKLPNEEDLLFAFRELIQNAGDAVKDAVRASARAGGRSCANVVHTEEKIEWMLGDECFLGIYIEPNGVRIRQIGVPLNKSAMGSGTKSKAKEAGEAAGGFGDGLKTAAVYLVSMGACLDLHFYNFGARHSFSWVWGSKIYDDDCDEETLGVEFVHGEERAVPTPFPADAPIMETFVHASDPTLVNALKNACAHSLRSFVWLLYEYEADPDGYVFSAPGHGEWRRRETMSCVVDSFCGVSFDMATLFEGRSIVVASGLAYPFDGAPSGLVIVNPTRGIPGDDFQIFLNHFRVVADALISGVFYRQFRAFLAIESQSEKMTEVLMPLIRGGSTFVIGASYPGYLATQALGHMDVNTKVREMLLFQRLSPAEWGANGISEAEERRQVQQRIKEVVFATKGTVEMVRWLQFLCGKSPHSVVVIDPFLANQQLFRVADTQTMEFQAGRALLKEIGGNSRRARPLDNQLLAAVNYMSDGRVTVVRVVKEPGEGIMPYSFSPRSDPSVIVVFQPGSNDEQILQEVCVQLQVRATLEQARRVQAFLIHFMSPEAKRKSGKDRVKHAITQADLHLPRTSSGKKRSIDEVQREEASERAEAAREQERKVQKALPKFDAFKLKSNRPEKPPVQLFNHSEGVRDAPRALPQGGHAGASGPRAADEPEGTREIDQEWNAELGILLPKLSDDRVVELPTNLTELLGNFNTAVSLLRASVHTGRCQFFASFSPNADWAGLHHATGDCLVNIAFKTTVPEQLRTLVHEMAHESASHHDQRYVKASDMISEKVMEHLLSR
jgi:predicted metallopeptidase